MRVLVVEDYAPLRKAVVQGLKEAGFAVDAAGDGEEGLWYARSNQYDVIVLDLMLPKKDGLSILSSLRQAGDPVHILILTARDTLDDRVRGLNGGADDYLVKPFAFEELLARVRALVRRRYESKSPMIRVADLEIDTVARVVRRAGTEVNLTAREYALLEFLALRAGQLVSRSDIWEHLYEFDSSAQSNVVDVYIGYLRRKLERPQWPHLIHTRRGQGYVLGEPS
jgi:DNA-binding response OmpR family regulator